MLDEFLKHIKNNDLMKKSGRLLLAISGGADSVVLAHLCKEAGFTITLAHCNFQLRGAESDRDETFVRELATAWNLPLLVQHSDTEKLAQEHKLSIQEMARKIRYEWFAALTDPASSGRIADYVVTAHHADDNVETLLINFFRGTGIKGLGGIPPQQGNIIRPLLFAKKEAILAYALQNGLNFVEDSSNLTDKYTRNNFRLNIIPQLREIYPDVENNLLDNIQRFRESALLYEMEITRLKKRLLQPVAKQLRTPVLLLKQQPALHTLVYELYQPFGFSPAQGKEIIKLLDAPSGKQVLSHTHRIIRHRKWLLLVPIETSTAMLQVWESHTETIVFPEGTLEQTRSIANPETTKSADQLTALLDADCIQFPLILRPWKAGDYFYPQGLGKKKKISRFLIDNKVAVSDKEKVYVLESCERIVWVVGMRIDDRCKITPGTKQLLTIRFLAAE